MAGKILLGVAASITAAYLLVWAIGGLLGLGRATEPEDPPVIGLPLEPLTPEAMRANAEAGRRARSADLDAWRNDGSPRL